MDVGVQQQVGDRVAAFGERLDAGGDRGNEVIAAAVGRPADLLRGGPAGQDAAQALQPDGRTVIVLTREDGSLAGDSLTSASHIEDDYRFHDAFRLAHAAVLGWSPVSRFLLGGKRHSRPRIDEAEDGAHATAIEDGISALVFAYAGRYHYFENLRHVDHELLITIDRVTAHLEVSVLRAADWEKAIMTGYRAWRQLRNHGGHLQLVLDTQSLTFIEP
ncbi:hypothetical protein ACFUTR_36005 [Streptomyces sp. NPDC057367]|uniref:hypothetical protein n=1 Tax=Streptomyces sp. NPDC057367 TaxID=3346108 RepID=UPI003644BC7F